MCRTFAASVWGKTIERICFWIKSDQAFYEKTVVSEFKMSSVHCHSTPSAHQLRPLRFFWILDVVDEDVQVVDENVDCGCC